MTRTEILLRDEKRTSANGEADGGIDRGTFILWLLGLLLACVVLAGAAAYSRKMGRPKSR